MARRRPLSSWRGWALVALFLALPGAAYLAHRIDLRARVAEARACIPVLEERLRASGWPVRPDEVVSPALPPEADASDWWQRLEGLAPRWRAEEHESAARLETLVKGLPPGDRAVPVLEALARAIGAGSAFPAAALEQAYEVGRPPPAIVLAAMRAELERGAPFLLHAEELRGLQGVPEAELLEVQLESFGGADIAHVPALPLRRLLATRSRVALADGATEDALAALELQLDLERAARGFPSVIAALRRLQLSRDACLDLLGAAPRFAEQPALDALAQRIAELDPWATFGRLRGLDALWARRLVESESSLLKGPDASPTPLTLAEMLEYDVRLAEWCSLPLQEARRSAATVHAAFDALGASEAGELASLFVTSPRHAFQVVLEAETLRRMALVAIVDARQGRAAARGVAAASADPFGSAAFSTREDGEGAWLLWSVWRDGADDGGRCEPLSLEAADFVLRLR